MNTHICFSTALLIYLIKHILYVCNSKSFLFTRLSKQSQYWDIYDWVIWGKGDNFNCEEVNSCTE